MKITQERAFVCCYRRHDGEVVIRCRDGFFRNRPWGGTFGECISLHTERGARRIQDNTLNRTRVDNFYFFSAEGMDSLSEIWQQARKAM